MIVDSPGLANPWRALFGSIFYPSGEGVFTIHERKRHQELMAHLEELFAMYPDAFFFVVLDNASAHTTPKLDEFKEKHKGQMGWVYQPTYSPHLNLIERLWRLMRSQVTKSSIVFSLLFSYFCDSKSVDSILSTC